MKFVLTDAAHHIEKIIELNTITDIMALINKYDYPIIFYDEKDYPEYNYPIIKIYNDYLE